MKNISKMVKLDFLTMKSQLGLYLVLILILSMFAYMGSSIIVLSITCSWFIALLFSDIFAIQDKNKLNRLYSSFSLKLKDIIIGRYAYIFLNFLVSLLLLNIIHFIVMLILNNSPDLLEYCLGCSVSFLLFSIIMSIQLPIYFGMEYTKAKIWALLPYLIVMGIIIIPSLMISFGNIMEFMVNNKAILFIFSFGLSLISIFISYKISLKTYQKRY